jgi:hypothetical protein
MAVGYCSAKMRYDFGNSLVKPEIWFMNSGLFAFDADHLM